MVQLYRPYSNVEFMRLFQYERERNSLIELLFKGLPSYLAMHGVQWLRQSIDWFQDRPWYVSNTTPF